MSNRIIKQLSINKDAKIIFKNHESYRERLKNQLEKYSIPSGAIKMYLVIFSYSNQVDNMNMNFLSMIINIMYQNNDSIDNEGVNKIVEKIVGKPESYKDQEEYRNSYIKMLATTVRYIKHYNDCRKKANVNIDSPEFQDDDPVEFYDDYEY